MIIVIMGVAGSGKTTIGEMLAKRMNIPFYDGDLYHPEENVKKMASGIPLTDTDREPWLHSLAQLVTRAENEGGAVVACSALKQRYREMLSSGGTIQFVYLKGTQELISRRLLKRSGHFLPPQLLNSQFEALEEPDDAVVVSVDKTPDEVCREIMSRLPENG